MIASHFIPGPQLLCAVIAAGVDWAANNNVGGGAVYDSYGLRREQITVSSDDEHVRVAIASGHIGALWTIRKENA